MTPKVTRAGDRGLLADFGADVAATELHARAAALRAREDVVACIVGHQSLYVIFRGAPKIDFDDVPPITIASRTHVIDVDFSGPDLDELLAQARVTREAFLTRIPSLRLTARYLGFRAGFAYLEGWPEEWRMPRRERSRNLVPRGSFAVAGAMAGFYPVDSPGGWNLLGRTNATLWDPNAEPPNRFAPGDVVSLRAASIDHFDAPTVDRIDAIGDVVAEVVMPGQLTTIVGTREWKRATYGVTPGGAFDVTAAASANRAVGNGDVPLLECVLVAPRLRFRVAKRAAFCDGSGNVRTFTLSAGEELDIGRFHGGLRGYLAIEGGIDEMRAQFAEGPRVLRKGDSLFAVSGPGTSAVASSFDRGDLHVIRVVAGPHDAPPLPEEWEVTSELNRIGIRLRRRAGGDTAGEPPALRQTTALHDFRELPSCGMQFGTLQWHADGSLVAMGPDHPVTGGYLQPATVISKDLWKLAQLAPGEQIRFEVVGGD
ncbi:MAG TPA: carboxyltransferase domain-containing protein [Thermoanaerobaculia bacterium]|jgi:KipI family sensor histidine kinase inhibitor|nr:carboxyltransferase domain-containing protein [Thermoanaerobaculia bacterium]